MFTFQHLLLIALFYIYAAGTGIFYVVVSDDLQVRTHTPLKRRLITLAAVFGWPMVVIIAVFQEYRIKLSRGQ